VVILVVEEAWNGVALGGRNPQVGGAGIEDNLEALRGSSDLNDAKVLGIFEVRKRDINSGTTGLNSAQRVQKETTMFGGTLLDMQRNMMHLSNGQGDQ
jgi:hypothetical protein